MIKEAVKMKTVAIVRLIENFHRDSIPNSSFFSMWGTNRMYVSGGEQQKRTKNFSVYCGLSSKINVQRMEVEDLQSD